MNTAALAAPTWPATSTTNWTIAERAGEQARRLVNRVAAGTLHALCTQMHCDLYVEPKSGCVPGSSYPLLVNSAKAVGAVPSRCELIGEQGNFHQVVHLQSAQALVTSIMSGDDLTIAFPTQGGAMDVLNIQSKGAAELIAGALGIRQSQADPVPETIRQSEHEIAVKAAVQASTTRAEI